MHSGEEKTPAQSPESLDAAAGRAAEHFAQFDFFNNKRHSHRFYVMTKVPTAEEAKRLGPNYYLFVKEPGKSWQYFYTNSVDNKITLEQRDPNNIATGLEATLSSGDFTEEKMQQIDDIIKARLGMATVLRVYEELFQTEEVFLQRTNLFAKTYAGMVRVKLDANTQREFDSYIKPYQAFSNPFGEYKLSFPENATIEEKLTVYDKAVMEIMANSSGDDSELAIKFKKNMKAMQDIMSTKEKFEAFVNQVEAKDRPKEAPKTARYFVLPPNESESFSSFMMRPAQRLARYSLLLDAIAKDAQDPGMKERIAGLSNAMRAATTVGNQRIGLSDNLNKRRVASALIAEIQALQAIDPRFNAANLLKAAQELHAGHQINDDTRKAVRLDLLLLYTRVYQEHRIKQKKTVKDETFTKLENTLLIIEGLLESVQVKPFLVKEHASEIDKKVGAENREEFMFALLASEDAGKARSSKTPVDSPALRAQKTEASEARSKVIFYLYNQMKALLKALPGASGTEQDRIRLQMINNHKILEKIGVEAKSDWNKFVQAPQDEKGSLDEEGVSMGVSLTKLIIPADHVARKLDEATITGLVDDCIVRNLETARTKSPREQKEATSTLTASPVSAAATEFQKKLEVYGVIVKHLLAAQNEASHLPFEQANIIDKFASKILGQTLQTSPGQESKEANINNLDPAAMATAFSENLIHAYLEARIHAVGEEKARVLPIFRKMILDMNTELQQLPAYQNKAIQGMLPLPLNEKLDDQAFDKLVLRGLFPEGALVRDRSAVPAVVKSTVKHLFDQAVGMIERPHLAALDNKDGRAFQNLLATLRQLDAPAEWNYLANAHNQSRLAIANWSSLELIKLVYQQTARYDLAEREGLVNKAVECASKALKEHLGEDKEGGKRIAPLTREVEDILKAVIASNVDSPTEFRKQLRLAVYEILKNAYIDDRYRSGGVSEAGPYLAAVVDFVKNFDIALKDLGQEPLVIHDPTQYRNKKPIEVTELLFVNAPKALDEADVKAYLKRVLDGLVADFTAAQQHPGDANKLHTAEKHYVNAIKAIQRLCGGDANTYPHGKALWNQLIQAVATKPELGMHAFLLATPLDEKAKVKESYAKDFLKELPKVDQLFHGVMTHFTSMQQHFTEEKMITDYKKKSETNPFYAGRTTLVDAMLAVQELKPVKLAREVWNNLVKANASLYGNEFMQAMLFTGDKKLGKDDIKTAFEIKLKTLEQALQLPAVARQAVLAKYNKGVGGAEAKAEAQESSREQSKFKLFGEESSKVKSPSPSSSLSQQSEDKTPPSPRPGSPSSTSSSSGH